MRRASASADAVALDLAIMVRFWDGHEKDSSLLRQCLHNIANLQAHLDHLTWPTTSVSNDWTRQANQPTKANTTDSTDIYPPL